MISPMFIPSKYFMEFATHLVIKASPVSKSTEDFRVQQSYSVEQKQTLCQMTMIAPRCLDCYLSSSASYQSE